MFGGGDLALAVGGDKDRGGSSKVWGKGLCRAEPQREQDGGDSFNNTTDSSIREQYRTASSGLKYTRSSYKPAICMDSGLPFDASSEPFGGRGCIGQNRGESEAAATLSSTRPIALSDSKYRTVVCALKYTRSSYKLTADVFHQLIKPAIYVGSALSFDASPGVFGEEDLALAEGGGRP